MDWILRFLTENWPRKLISLVAAILIWALVSHSISVTKKVAPVSVHLVNVPQGYVLTGVQQNGVFDRTLSLQISGEKSLIESLRPSDLSVVLDASGKPQEWVAQLSSNDIRSTNPDLKLARRLQLISPREVIVKMSPMVSERLPVFFTDPIGEPPYGYECLDIYPRKLYVTVSGPEDQIKRMKAQGLALTLDLSTISRDEIEWLEQQIGSGKDEISLPIPGRWLKVRLPFLNAQIPIDDPEATHARIIFVKEQMIPLNGPLPVTAFYPASSRGQFNPIETPLLIEGPISALHGIPVIDRPLFVSGVSRIFLDLVRGNLTLFVIARPDPETGLMPCNFQIMDLRALENKFLKRMLAESSGPTPREEAIRARFRSYLRKFQMLSGDNRPVRLEAVRVQEGIRVNLQEGPPAGG
jgi:hypothetical protein